MKTTAHRDELLSTIVLDPTLHPVIDDLAGLERLVPVAPGETESLAIFRNQLPGLLALRGRGQAHTEQVRRLILLLAREKGQVERWIDVANALTLLTNASNLALLLLPTRSEDDVWAREQFGRNLLRHARRNGDGEDIALARRAVGDLPQRPAHLALPTSAAAVAEMIETMARRVGALQPKPQDEPEPGAPRAWALEQADSLKAYFAAAPGLADLLDGACKLFALIDDLRRGYRPTGMDDAAIEGGLILAYARLLRIALWPARSAPDVATKIAARDLVRARDADPDRLGALWEIAFGQGETVAGQSNRFLNIDEIG
ncbi:MULTISPECIES: hypothetical protein [Bosea]|jgi:hypothetical protein|uniref:hypothetical protein n=1 Tax=Bosea TaxID=85413 RepID=UPI00215024FA|nr:MULTISPECIES: hypothetical protein [Bosea]MCR4524517.1 hypothetical protein [Bosea sp. 47.2.35]MDR6831321.1 hypothetical protein [Bosea robiniae]MDR6898035.1 hypothetical protein [Bosea sp. BE109]MDR7141458.1 hypothetical protein [Bosea sp. BE168]MDR7178094.1 hypothetical protein [Bosea sp. BE271]